MNIEYNKVLSGGGTDRSSVNDLYIVTMNQNYIASATLEKAYDTEYNITVRAYYDLDSHTGGITTKWGGWEGGSMETTRVPGKDCYLYFIRANLYDLASRQYIQLVFRNMYGLYARPSSGLDVSLEIENGMSIQFSTGSDYMYTSSFFNFLNSDNNSYKAKLQIRYK